MKAGGGGMRPSPRRTYSRTGSTTREQKRTGGPNQARARRRDLGRAPPALPTARHRCRLPGRGREQSPARGRCPRRRRTVTAKRRTSARGARSSAYRPQGRCHATQAAENERGKRGAVGKERQREAAGHRYTAAAPPKAARLRPAPLPRRKQSGPARAHGPPSRPVSVGAVLPSPFPAVPPPPHRSRREPEYRRVESAAPPRKAPPSGSRRRQAHRLLYPAAAAPLR